MDNQITEQTKHKKKNYYKIIIIIIDIIVILCIAISLKNKYLDNKIDYQDYQFKVFTYSVPNNISFEPGDFTFSLKNINDSNWNAEIEIYVTNTDQYIEFFKEYLIKKGYNLSDSYEKEVNGVKFDIIKTNKDNENILICFYKTQYRYLYEVNIHNDDNSFDDTSLDDISSILVNGKYDETLEGRFYYHITKYSVQNEEDD